MERRNQKSERLSWSSEKTEETMRPQGRAASHFSFGQGNVLVVIALDEEEASVTQDVAQPAGGIWKAESSRT